MSLMVVCWPCRLDRPLASCRSERSTRQLTVVKAGIRPRAAVTRWQLFACGPASWIQPRLRESAIYDHRRTTSRSVRPGWQSCPVPRLS